MELALKRNNSIFEILSDLFHKKGENILYEEGVIPVGIDLEDSLKAISTELSRIKCKKNRLIIIDKYFTAVMPNGSAETFLDWVTKMNIKRIDIYSDIETNCFKSALIECFDGTVPLGLHQIPDGIHDRFWFFKIGDSWKGLMVGTSLNGFGKRLCIVCKIKRKDLNKLREILKDTKIFEE